MFLSKVTSMSTRRERGLTENIFLVKFDTSEVSLVFHVLGSSHRVYKVSLVESHEPKCSCPDYCTRKRTCKHIYFVCEKVLQISPTDWNLVTDISQISTNVITRLPNLHVIADDYYTKQYNDYLNGKEEERTKKEKGIENFCEVRNDECCVCLCFIESKSSKDIMVCSTCKNGIHSVCWKKWSQVNGSNKCVYCRTKLQSNGKATTHAKVIEDAGWGVLLQ